LYANAAVIVAGTLNALAENAANGPPRFRPRPIPSRSRPTRTRVTEAPIRIDTARSDVFIETPKQRPMRKPAISARRIVNAPLSNTAMHNNQSGAQRLSVRNSTEHKQRSKESPTKMAAQTPTRREKSSDPILYVHQKATT